MKRIPLVFAAICAFGALLFIQGCGPAHDSTPIKIGALFSITGPASFLGVPEQKTAQMLVEKINAAGGVNGRKLQLVVKDTAGSPEKAVSSAKQLIEVEKVLAIIGPSTSGETMQIKALCERNRIPLISCAEAETVVNPAAKYVFKVAPNDSLAVTWIYRTMKDRGMTNIAILSSTEDFGVAGKQQLETAAPAAGITILANEVYDMQATDLTDVLTRVKGNSSVQAVVNWSIGPAQAIVAKSMKPLGLDVPLFQSPGVSNRKYIGQAGVAAEGTLFPAGRLLVVGELPASNPQKQVLATYKKDYEGRYKEDVSTFGGHAYDSLMIVVEALKKAGAPDRDKVRDAIENLKSFVGTAGVFNFSPTDHTGLDLNAFEMLTVKDGKFTIYKK
jgi:branched-chain amino acid transport system substrate-binding protein